MTYIGSQGADRRLNCRYVGLRRPSPRFAHRVIPALWGLTLLLSIALAEVIGSDALASGCGDWAGDEARAFWATATVETIAPCLDTADFDELEFGGREQASDDGSSVQQRSCRGGRVDRGWGHRGA